MAARLSLAGVVFNLMLLCALVYVLAPGWQARQALVPTVVPENRTLAVPNGYRVEVHGEVTYLYGPFSISTAADDMEAFRAVAGRCVVLVDTANPVKESGLRISKTVEICIEIGNSS